MPSIEIDVDLTDFSTADLVEELSLRKCDEIRNGAIENYEILCTMIIEGRLQEALEVIGDITGGKINSAVYIQRLKKRKADKWN